MDYNKLSEIQLLSIIERARRDTEFGIDYKSIFSIKNSLVRKLDYHFSKINNNSSPYHCQVGSINIIEAAKEHNYKKSLMGSSMYLAGRPILKKRFVMEGSVKGTSIASKYLSRALPQQMSFRLFKTNVLGRIIGRAVPYAGVALLVIDALEFLIEVYEIDKKTNKVTFKGFGNGGRFGGGGANGYW